VWQVVFVWCAIQVIFNFQIAATNALLADQVPAARRSTVSGFLGLALAVGPLLGIAAVGGLSSPVAQWGHRCRYLGDRRCPGPSSLLREPAATRATLAKRGLNVHELLKSFLAESPESPGLRLGVAGAVFYSTVSTPAPRTTPSSSCPGSVSLQGKSAGSC